MTAMVVTNPLKRAEELLSLAEEAKELGTAHYRKAAFGRAARRYSAAVTSCLETREALKSVTPAGLRFDPAEAAKFVEYEATKASTGLAGAPPRDADEALNKA